MIAPATLDVHTYLDFVKTLCEFQIGFSCRQVAVCLYSLQPLCRNPISIRHLVDGLQPHMRISQQSVCDCVLSVPYQANCCGQKLDEQLSIVSEFNESAPSLLTHLRNHLSFSTWFVSVNVPQCTTSVWPSQAIFMHSALQKHVYQTNKHVYQTNKHVYQTNKHVYQASKHVYQTNKHVYLAIDFLFLFP